MFQFSITTWLLGFSLEFFHTHKTILSFNFFLFVTPLFLFFPSFRSSKTSKFFYFFFFLHLVLSTICQCSISVLPFLTLLEAVLQYFCSSTLCLQQGRGSTLDSLLKSAANAVLKLMSAVIAIAHVLFVSMKSLSLSIMLLEYSFGRLKYDSTTLPMSGFLGSSPVSASKSPVSLAILNFLLSRFQCG